MGSRRKVVWANRVARDHLQSLFCHSRDLCAGHGAGRHGPAAGSIDALASKRRHVAVGPLHLLYPFGGRCRAFPGAHQARGPCAVDRRRLLVHPAAPGGSGRRRSAPVVYGPLARHRTSSSVEFRAGAAGSCQPAGHASGVRRTGCLDQGRVADRMGEGSRGGCFGGGRSWRFRHVVLPAASAAGLRGSHAGGALQARRHRIEYREPFALLYLAGAAHDVS